MISLETKALIKRKRLFFGDLIVVYSLRERSNLEMDEFEIKRKLVEVSKRLYNRGLVAGAGGNVSARIPETEEIFITPSGLCKGFLRVEDILKINLEGKVIEGKLKPTSETPMHTSIYKTREDVMAIVHAHPPFCTGFACARVPLDYRVFPEIIAMVGEIPLVEYVTPTTEELAEKVAEYAKKYNALLLANHGTITLGASLEQAYQRTELLEDFAKILLVSNILGGPKSLSESEVKKLRKLESERYRIRLIEKL